MKNAIRTTVRTAVQLVLLWFVAVCSLAVTAWVVPGIDVRAHGPFSRWAVAAAAVLLLAAVNLLVRPLVVLLARPLGWMALMAVGFVLNAGMILATAWLLPVFDATFWAAMVASFTMSFLSGVLTGVLDVNHPGSWYRNRMRRLAARRPFDSTADPGRGLLLVEIDGLSFWHLRKALEDGRMPTLAAMMDEDGYRLSRVDCGLPSMTSSCQAGIMFGDNHDIPSYRWYDKSRQKLYVSASDAPELNRRYAHGKGLMRGGVSILNMMNGDAATSLFTMADMFGGDAQDRRNRAEDISILLLNPYFLTRATGLFLADLVRELWEGWRQKRNDVQPRLNRLAEYYPFVRAAMCGLMREIAVNLATLNLMRGAPVIYMLYLGYDEVAHHSGPWTEDAFGDLARLDDSLAQLRQATKDTTPRPYEFIILSDHGQSFGATFKQRYGSSIKEFIETLMPRGATVAESVGADTGGNGLLGLAAGLADVEQGASFSAARRATARMGKKLASGGAGAAENEVAASEAAVTAYGSGNACQVYFDLFPRKIALSELESAYPGMIEALVAHEGIGLVLGHDDDGAIVALGKGGRRNLSTGEVTGDDPVRPFAREAGPGQGTVEKRVWQLKRVMDFPSAGDLWLISTLYPDGTVAALEELIGNHGGLGGEQTDAFIFHPADVSVPDTRNATDFFAILNGRRGSA